MNQLSGTNTMSAYPKLLVEYTAFASSVAVLHLLLVPKVWRCLVVSIMTIGIHLTQAKTRENFTATHLLAKCQVSVPFSLWLCKRLHLWAGYQTDRLPISTTAMPMSQPHVMPPSSADDMQASNHGISERGTESKNC